MTYTPIEDSRPPRCDCPPTEKSREQAMLVLERDDTGKPTVWCDPCLAPLITALNAGGLRIVASCCGHGERVGSVVLTDGRELLVREFPHVWSSEDLTHQPKETDK